MSIILGVIVPALLFLITLPLQSFLFLLRQSLKAIEIQERISKGSLGSKLGLSKGSDKLRSELGLSPKKNKNSMSAKIKSKSKIALLKAMQLAIRALSSLISLLRSVATSLITLVVTAFGVVIPICIAVIITASSIVMFMNTKGSSTTYGNVVSNSSTGSNTSKDNKIDSSASADVQKMINMSDKELWLLASEGRFKSYSEANTALKTNTTKEVAFWNGLKKDIKVKVWKWADSSHKKKKEVEVVFTVNKHLAKYWKAFLTDWHNLPEKYVLESVGSTFGVRVKNNKSGTGNYSAHSFGGAIDINPMVDGMGSVVPGFGDPNPWKTSKGLKEPYKSTCCTFDNSWSKLVKKYKMDWGGYFSPNFLDPMHFSIIGDRSKDTRTYKPSSGVTGATPK